MFYRSKRPGRDLFTRRGERDAGGEERNNLELARSRDSYAKVNKGRKVSASFLDETDYNFSGYGTEFQIDVQDSQP